MAARAASISASPADRPHPPPAPAHMPSSGCWASLPRIRRQRRSCSRSGVGMGYQSSFSDDANGVTGGPVGSAAKRCLNVVEVELAQVRELLFLGLAQRGGQGLLGGVGVHPPVLG